jgi:hypothetical protein
MGRRGSIILGSAALLLAAGNLVLPDSGYGYRLTPGGVLTWNQLFLIALLFAGAAVGWSARTWRRSGWAAATLAVVPLAGVGLGVVFC